jgi:N-acetylglucosaminyldiphosphoundecaprenol N-acetyl-beta-D-mannosaminyltransferase
MGIRIDLIQISEVIEHVSGWIKNRRLGNYIVVANVYDVVSSRKDIIIRDGTNASTLTVPDGISLVWFARFKGYSLKDRVYGPDLMLEFLKASEAKAYSHFFYGATEKTLNLLIDNLKIRFPGLRIVGSYAPPFRTLNVNEDRAIINMINKLNPDVVWVGLGCPKQQLWMHEHKNKLTVPVMVGVGAAFDFLAGVKPQAPRWIRDNGFEWLFRLVTEPKRLWRRYLVSYPLFIYYIFVDLIKGLIKPCKI